VPQGKKKSALYSYFVCEYRKEGGRAVDPTRYIYVHADPNGHPVSVAPCEVTAKPTQHLIGEHGVIASSMHVGGHAAGERNSGPRGGGPCQCKPIAGTRAASDMIEVAGNAYVAVRCRSTDTQSHGWLAFGRGQ